MATLVSIGSGNFTSAATWGVGNAASLSISASTVSAVPLAATNSAAFTPGAITVSGVCVFLNTRASTSGTFTVQIWNTTANAAVAGASVTVNLTDLPTTVVSTGTTTVAGIGWTYFEFAAPVTLLAATNYAVRVNTSVTATLGIWRTATANDWLRILVTTTTAAPAATDNLVISGKHTGAGVNQEYTVTMNNTTSATTFGTVAVGTRGKLIYGVSASTNYYLKIAGSLGVYASGGFFIGSSGSPMPASSSGVLEVTTTSAGQFIVQSEGIFEAYGNPITTQANLAADVSAGSTTSTTDVSTGWLNGDTILVPSTTATPTQAETEVLTANAVGTALTHTAYGNAHGGNATTLVQARIGNLTRNVRIIGTNPTTPPYILVRGRFTYMDLSYAEIKDMGSTTTATASLTLNPVTNTSGSCFLRVNGCSIWRSTSTGSGYGFYIAAIAGGIVRMDFTNTIFYNYAVNCFATHSSFASDTFTNQPIFNDNLVYRATGAGAILTAATEISGNVFSSNTANGLTYTPSGIGTNFFNEKIFENNIFHSNGAVGLSITQPGLNTTTSPFLMSNNSMWRNGGFGFLFSGNSAGGLVGFYNGYSIIDGLRIFGNLFGIQFTSITGKILVTNSYIWGGSTIVQQYGIYQLNTSAITYPGTYRIDFSGGGMGYDHLGNVSSHSAGNIGRTYPSRLDFITFSGTQFSGTDYVFASVGPGIDDLAAGGYVSLNHNGVSGSHKSFMPTSTTSTDLTIYNSSPLSLRIAPATTLYKSTTVMQRIPVKGGTSCTVSVSVRQSSSSDGTQYNGAAPRLIYRYNYLAGNLDNTVGATASSGLYGTWETLTYTTSVIPYNLVLEFYVDCDGTSGWVNVDDWSTNVKNDTRKYDYWALTSGPYVQADYNPGQSAYTFVS